MPGTYIPSWEDPPITPGWDPTDPSDPGSAYVWIDLVSQDITATYGSTVTAAVVLKSATPVTLYLRLGSSVLPVAVTSTETRFSITAVVGTGFSFKVSTQSGDYSTLSVDIAGARADYGSTALPLYTTSTPDYTLSPTGLVTFAAAPTGALTWTGSFYGSTPYEIETPYSVEDLGLINFTQSADVMILVHPSIRPQWIGRYGDASWTLTAFDHKNGPFEDINTDIASLVTISAVTGLGKTVTAAKDIFTSDDLGKLFYLETKDAGTPWEAGKAVSAGNIRMAGGMYYEAKGNGTTGTLRPSHESDEASDGGVTWTYKNQGFGIGRISSYISTKQVTVDVKSDFNSSCIATGSYKWAKGPWSDGNGYPSVVTFHQQRLFFAGSASKPNTFWSSRTGSYQDFGTSNPIRDDDGIAFNLLSNQANTVNGLISLGSLLSLSEGGTFVIGSEEPMTPSALSAKLQGYRGASHLAPLGVGNAVVYIQAKGQNLRDLSYEFASNSYNGGDLNRFASHLVNGYQIDEWCYQPLNSIIWCVRDDGTLLGLTYMRDQEVLGWHRHDTLGGLFESVCCVSEGDEDSLYVSVLRGTHRYIERFASRNIQDIKDSFFVDCGLSFDGRNTTSTTITLSGGTNWDDTETINLAASAATFVYPATTDAGDQIVLEDSDGYVYRVTIVATTSTTAATGIPTRTIPAEFRNVAVSDWAWARDTFSGLSHLEGQTVAILADGCVHPQQVVASGAIHLDPPSVRVHAGLPIEADLETLDISIPNGETVMDKQKLIPAVRLMLQESGSVKAGRNEANLYSAKIQDTDSYDEPNKLFTGVAEVRIETDWNKTGGVLIRQDSPLPLTVLAILPEVEIGGA